MENILISACLIGCNTRYKGDGSCILELAALKDKYNLIPVCPEQLGGLATPRDPAEIVSVSEETISCEKDKSCDSAVLCDATASGPASQVIARKVITCNGRDVTEQFAKGADEALKLAKLFECKIAVMKERSPSCGFGRIYDGTFSGTLTDGNGLTAELLSKNGIRIVGESKVKETLLRASYAENQEITALTLK